LQQLYYLREVTDPSAKNRFVYFCPECLCILKVRKSLEPVESIIEVLENHCPSCGSTLEGTLSCRRTLAADEWAEITPSNYTEGRVRSRRASTLFRPASLTREASFNLSPLERLVGGFAPGRVGVFAGRYAGSVAEFFCFKAQLPERHGGLDTDVVFIDGGNCSDPYLFSSYARQYMVRPREALRRVVTSRAFTIYQLANLVRKELPAVIEEHASRLVIISDILSMFNDPSLDAREAKRVVEAVREGLLDLQKRMEAFALVTITTRTPYDKLIMDSADLLLNLDPANSRIMAMLLKPGSVQLGEEELLRPVLRERGTMRRG